MDVTKSCARFGMAAVLILSLLGPQAQAAARSHSPVSSLTHQVALAKRQLVRQLRDPQGSRYQDVVAFRSTDTHAIWFCGEVNMRNAFGGYTGFTRFIATDTTAMIADDDLTGGLMEGNWQVMCTESATIRSVGSVRF